MKKLHFVLAAILLIGFSTTTAVIAQKSTTKKAAVTSSVATTQSPDSILFSEVKYRLVGPFRGGRSAAVAGSYVNNNTFYFGATGGGLWKTVDGGSNWKNLSDKKIGGNIGAIAVAPSDENILYVGEGENTMRGNVAEGLGGMWRSKDGGKTFTNIGLKEGRHIIRIVVHPRDPNTVWAGVVGHLFGPNEERGVYKTTDGGKTWETMSATHGDYHDLWINPSNSNNMIIADDGGAGVTFNGGKSWSSQDIYATAQFYRINVDNEFPYNIYGGQQDNSSVKIASRSFGGGINVTNWTSSAGGESAFLAFNPDNTRYVLGGSYQGTIDVFDSKSKGSTNIMAAPIQYLGKDAKDDKYRFNWNAPIIWSKHEPNTYYHGAQVLLRTTDMGKTWTEASPDLTRNEKAKQGKPGGPYTNEAVGAENYGTLAYVIESVHEKGVIYTGSDDGLLEVKLRDLDKLGLVGEVVRVNPKIIKAK